MATLKAKVKHQLVKVKEQKMYVAHSLYASKIGLEEIIKLAAEDSGMTEAMVAASFYAVSKQFEQMLFNGHIIQCGVFGTFRTSFSCKATKEQKDMSVANITRRRIIYTASPRLRRMHNNVAYEFE